MAYATPEQLKERGLTDTGVQAVVDAGTKREADKMAGAGVDSTTTTTPPTSETTTTTPETNQSASSSSMGDDSLRILAEYNANVKKQEENKAGIQARGGVTQTGTGETTDISGTQYTTMGAYSSAMKNAEDQLKTEAELAKAKLTSAEETRRLEMVQSLSQTDAGQRVSASGGNLASWSMDELESLWATDVGDLSSENKERIRSGKKPELDMLAITRNMGLSENEYSRRTIEREYGRAVTDREEYNSRQDAKEERLLAAFGGGKVKSLSSNVAVMKNQEQRLRELDDIRDTFIDNATLVSDKANAIIDKYTVQARAIEQSINTDIESAYSKITTKLDELIQGKITNIDALNTALAEDFKEYSTTYADLLDKQLNYEIDLSNQQQSELNDFKKYVLDTDKQYSDMTGMIYMNGKPLTDASGNHVQTADFTDNASDKDIKLMLGTGTLWQNGQMVVDANGKPMQIPLGMMDEISYNETSTNMMLDKYNLTKDDWKNMDQNQRDWYELQIKLNQENRLSYESGYETNLPADIGSSGFSNANSAGDKIDTGLALGTLGTGLRTDRHLNPIASKAYDATKKLLTNAGLVEGDDWFVGETTKEIDNDGVPTIGYPNEESALKGTIATLSGGQINTWYANPKYGGSSKILSKLSDLSGKSVNSSNAQEVFNSLPYENQVDVVKSIYSHEGGTKLFQ